MISVHVGHIMRGLKCVIAKMSTVTVWGGVVAILSITAAKSQEVRVIDGDTFTLGDQKYRLHGIDAPEPGQRCSHPDGGSWRCGHAAASLLKDLTSKGQMECDHRGIDPYDRILALCRAGGSDIGETMVLVGLAWAFRIYSLEYVVQEDLARASGKGIWQAPTQTAEDFRAERWKVAKQTAPEGCPIKGNISRNGHIYHVPWSRMYDRTKLSVEKGERWFCNEREALDAGWRQPFYDQ